MHRRAVVVAIMALFLFTGIASSAVCEMTCTPANQAAACCAHEMQDCTGTASVTGVHECSHTQENAAIVATDASLLQPHAAISIGPSISPLHIGRVANAEEAFLDGSLNRSSFIPPLRI